MKSQQLVSTQLSSKLERDCFCCKREAKKERALVIERKQGKAVEIITKGKGVVESERRHAMAELSDSVVDLAVIAGKIVAAKLSVKAAACSCRKYLADRYSR